MYAEMVERTRWPDSAAVGSLLGDIRGMCSGAGGSVRAGIGSRALRICRHSLTRKVVAGLLSATAVLAIAYTAAAALVNGASSQAYARTHHAAALQQAAFDYRRARAECLRLSASQVGACIAEAHAAEGRARAVASLALASYLSASRSRTDAGIDAGGRDGIILEPACTVVSLGLASICEIQVNSNGANVPAAASAKHPLINTSEDRSTNNMKLQTSGTI